MRIGPPVLALVAIACSKGGGDREARELASLDLAAAASRVRAMVDSCAGLARALDRLAFVSGRALAGLVDDAVTAAREVCPEPASATKGTRSAHQLARARLADDRPEAALAMLAAASTEPAIRFRRAELLDRLGRTREALAELEAALARAPDEAGRQTRRALQISIDVRAGRYAQAARTIAGAPLPDRPALAFRAAADIPSAALEPLGAAATEIELAAAVAERLERERGPAAALPAREAVARFSPGHAEHQDALARALAAAGRLDEALAAWDRAAATIAQPTYQLSPIRALVAARQPARARSRVLALAKAARASEVPERLLTARSAAAAIGDHTLAVALAREAKARRPADGRLAFTLAETLADAGDREAAADAYAELLVCGAHGRPWHRHEVAGRLILLATDAAAAELVAGALAAKRACTTVDPSDLATYIGGAREKLDALRSRPR